MKFLKLLIIFFITFLFTSCSAIIGNNNFDPGDNWESIISEYLICYYYADSFAEQNIEHIMQIEEEAYQHIINTLDVEYGDTISIYIYNSPEDAGWDHIQGMAYCKEKIAVGIYSEEGKSIGVKGAACHELTYIITWNALGKPGTTFINEGIAVAMDGEWHAKSDPITDLHQWTKKFIDEDSLPAIEEMVNNWDSFSGLITYPVSGSFVSYIIENYGIENYKELLVEAKKTNFNSVFLNIYKKELNAVEEEWKDYVLNYNFVIVDDKIF